uniref:Uncharacterized protein n=1 Tax=Scophthalmus maximus TaxID=52904 RepID=A0A8D2ZNY0_SCOMX
MNNRENYVNSQWCKARSKRCNASVCGGPPSSSLPFFFFFFFFPPRQPHFRCFSSLSPALLPSPCRLLDGLLRNILSSPLRASLR